MVDDEPDLLASMTRNLRSEHFDLTTATSGAQALEILNSHGPFAVLVSDLRMPGMDGVDLLGRARRICPDTVRVLFTGQPDMEMAIAAVNEGAIFRFITKPCSRLMMTVVLRSGIEQYELVTAQRILLEQTLHGSIKALTDVLALASPVAFGRATRLRQIASALVSALRIEDGWQVEVAAMLSQVGCVILPPAVLEKVDGGQPLDEEEEAMMRRVPNVVEQVLANIPRLERVRDILRFQDKHYDGTGHPAGEMSGNDIPWGARALRLILDLDRLESDGAALPVVFGTLRGRGGWYDPEILEALAKIRNSDQHSCVRELPLAGLRPGMILAQDVRTQKGMLFVARGQEVTHSLLEKFKNFSPGFHGADSVRVIVQEQSGESRTR